MRTQTKRAHSSTENFNGQSWGEENLSNFNFFRELLLQQCCWRGRKKVPTSKKVFFPRLFAEMCALFIYRFWWYWCQCVHRVENKERIYCACVTQKPVDGVRVCWTGVCAPSITSQAKARRCRTKYSRAPRRHFVLWWKARKCMWCCLAVRKPAWKSLQVCSTNFEFGRWEVVNGVPGALQLAQPSPIWGVISW